MKHLDFWVKLGYVRRHIRNAQAMWKHWFGDEFALVQPFLRRCPGVYATWYPDPESGMHREVYKAGDNWVAVLDNDVHLDEFPLELTESDVHAFRLDEDRLRSQLQRGLHLEGPATAIEPEFDCLGVCNNGLVRRQVYLCHAPDEQSALAWLLKASGRTEGAGCLLMPVMTDLVENSLRTVGMSGVSLTGNLAPLNPGTPTGVCGYTCRRFAPRAAALDVLSQKIDEGFSRIAEQTPQVPVVETPLFLFRQAGSHWDVIYDGGAPFHMEDSLGVRYLDYLLHHPNEAITAYDLETVIRPQKAEARPRNSIQAQADPAAVRAYLKEIDRLRAERDEAAENGQHVEAERIDADIERLEFELPGKQRSIDTGERARDNVRKAIAATLRALRSGGDTERAFAAHAQQCISVGYELYYSGGVWK